MSQQLQEIEFESIEAKSRFAALFPKDIKFLLNLIEDFREGFDVDPISGYSESIMMKERTRLKLTAYLDLFAGQDPEEIDPSITEKHLPEEFTNKWKRDSAPSV
jgi:hypothetical protein